MMVTHDAPTEPWADGRDTDPFHIDGRLSRLEALAAVEQHLREVAPADTAVTTGTTQLEQAR